MDELPTRVSTSLTPENFSNVTAEAPNSFDYCVSTQSRSTAVLPPNPKTGGGSTRNFDPTNVDTANPDGRHADLFKSSTNSISKPRFPPPKKLPCANAGPAHVQVDKYEACNKPGTMVCSECKLVSYCSKECQKTHWKLHKRDCKNPMRSEAWMPAWNREGRLPSFVADTTLEEDFYLNKTEEFSIGMSLWGNTPAMDIINLAENEKDEGKDFSLAFIASGDLRHVLSTINGLPSTYSGSLTILLNDLNPSIVYRNIVLLLILGNIPDEVVAADIALHFWYSAFMPMEYSLQISAILSKFLQQLETNEGVIVIPLGPCSTLSCCLSQEATNFLLHFLQSTPNISIGDAQKEYNRVRAAPSRRDFRDRMYARLRPSHRVAFQKYRQFGIVLPFGATTVHFNYPNFSLFSPQGRWLQTDYADPLGGWDVGAVVKTGKAHGARPEDIYGCLYFSLSETLRMSAQRIREFKMSFSLFALDARHLPKGIREGPIISGCGISPSTRFDRIEASNILDANYVGIDDVLTNWSPLLAESATSVIVGYFMNWFVIQEAGRAENASPSVTRGLLQSVMNKTMVKGRLPQSMGSTQNAMYLLTDDMDALYENSKPFSRFLRTRGLASILQKTKLRLREKHTIVPHRILAPIGGPPSARPVFLDDESWYYHTALTSFSWGERFVEFVRM